jgi:hypothetical protein
VTASLPNYIPNLANFASKFFFNSQFAKRRDSDIFVRRSQPLASLDSRPCPAAEIRVLDSNRRATLRIEEMAFYLL